jgi:hypothetical protein
MIEGRAIFAQVCITLLQPALFSNYYRTGNNFINIFPTYKGDMLSYGKGHHKYRYAMP